MIIKCLDTRAHTICSSLSATEFGYPFFTVVMKHEGVGLGESLCIF